MSGTLPATFMVEPYAASAMRIRAERSSQLLYWYRRTRNDPDGKCDSADNHRGNGLHQSGRLFIVLAIALAMVGEIAGTIVGRWYVTAYGVVFVVLALRHIGLKCTVIYTAIAVTIAALAENGSVRLGFPFTRYTYNPDLRGQELWVV